jgi:ATPase family AAA domain-containing protein 3A/B
MQTQLIQRAAAATDGFSGRELAKLMASMQAAAYGTPDAKLTESLFDMVLDLKLKQHMMRKELAMQRSHMHM